MNSNQHIEATNHPILLFDGVCNLCNGFVQFVIKRDPKGIFRFAPLQSDIGQKLLKKYGQNSQELSTVILIQAGKVHTHSDVALQVANKMGGFWSIFSVFGIIPKGLRDAIYNWVARNRYKWFGRKESCMIPTPELKERFLA